MKKDFNIIYETITGSLSYGTNIDNNLIRSEGNSDLILKESDEDRKGIFIFDTEDMFSLDNSEDTVCIHDPEDREYHSLKKFLTLAAHKQNPTVLEMLFMEDRFITEKNDLMDNVILIRDEFLTANCYWTFSGYARDQLIRIKNALSRTTNSEMETHLDYVLSRINHNVGNRFKSFSKSSGNYVKINEVSIKNNGKYSIDMSMDVQNGSFDEIFGMINEMNDTVKNYNKLKNRNRRVDEAKLWKHAMHLVRLLKTGMEILRGEGLTVYRYNDREELIDIRLGKWGWDEFFEYAEELFKEIGDLKDSNKVPKVLNKGKVNKVYLEMMEQYLDIKPGGIG